MDGQELRRKLAQRFFDAKKRKATTAGIANMLIPMLSFLHAGKLGFYGEALGCTNIEELVAAAEELKHSLKPELGEDKWKALF